MRTFSLTILIGRLGRDPEMRYTAEGEAVTTLSLATDRPPKPDGAVETDWHRIVCWAKLAEFAGQFLAKGRLVCVTGRICYRSWESRDGQRHRTAEITASELVPLDRKPDAEPADAPPMETEVDASV
jgi:single-strand DNA-binding protein